MTPRAWLAGALLALGSSATGAARADVALTTSMDGSIGAWLGVAGVPEGASPADFATPPALGAAAGPKLRWMRWTVTDGGPGPLDLRRALGQRRSHVALAAVLHASAPLHAWLLLSVDGAARVALDGRLVSERPTPHARGNAWDPVPLDADAGDHTLLLLLDHAGPAWNLETRLVSREEARPPPGLEWRLPGVPDLEGERLAFRLLRATASVGLAADGYHPSVHVEFPRGAPLVVPRVSLLPVTDGLRGVPPTVAAAPGVTAVPTAVRLDALQVRVREGDEQRLRVTCDPALPGLVARAEAARRALVGAGSRTHLIDRDVVATTLESEVRLLGKLADRADPGLMAVRTRLERLVAKLEDGVDPLGVPGVLSLARTSALDGAPERFALSVPPPPERGEAPSLRPLVVVLHGYGGNPERALTAFLGADARGASPAPARDGFALAPDAHGDAFYRGPGEAEVLDLVDWALAHLPIDPARVSITGISMGGTGAAHLAFRYPDRFAAMGALAGYHSYFVRRDVRGRPLRPWEWTELARWSPSSYADNALGQLLYLAQGTRDLPLVHTTVLAARLKELGYPFRESYPDSDHAGLPGVAWARGALFPVLARATREAVPARVVLKTDSLRLGRRAWVRVTALESHARPATITARVAAADRLVVTTDGVAAFELTRPAPRVPAGAPLTLEVDGRPLAYAAGEAVAAHREGDRRAAWQRGPLAASPLSKRPGVEGPIRDALTAPITFVYGTLDARETLVARQVAEHFRARWSGSAAFPVVADDAVGPRGGRNLFLVGSKTSNRVVRALDARLPFGVTDGGVRLGPRVLRGDGELGLAAVYPNPDDPDHVVVVVEGVSAAGLVRSMSLPGQLPDFIVFDSGLAPAAGEQVLGAARALAGGYFDRTWSVPPELGAEPPTASGARSVGGPPRAFAAERRILSAGE